MGKPFFFLLNLSFLQNGKNSKICVDMADVDLFWQNSLSPECFFFQILIWKEGLYQVLMAFHKILPLYFCLLLRRGNHKIFIALFFYPRGYASRAGLTIKISFSRNSSQNLQTKMFQNKNLHLKWFPNEYLHMKIYLMSTNS